MDKIGVIHGRFQILHNEHMKYLLAGKERCEYLLIGISKPDFEATVACESNPHRATNRSNPLSYYHRFQMIKGAMLEAGIPPSEFDILPFPIDHPDSLLNYVPKEAKFYMTIYDQWGREKKKSLEKLSLIVEVMWEGDIKDKKLSGEEVRRLIRSGEKWDHLVPNFVYNYIISNKLDQHIKSL